MISKNIHQIWIGDKSMPSIFNTWIDSWIKHHPDWSYTFWTDDDITRLVDQKYPELSDIYHGYDYDVSRSDAARYMILHEFGGLYCDVDVECFRCIEPLIANECVLFNEHPMHPLGKYFPVDLDIQTPSIYYAEPKSRFTWNIIKNLRCAFNGRNNYTNPSLREMFTTSSGFLTICYNRYVHVNKVSVVDHRHFEPLSKQERKDILLKNKKYTIADDMYGMHWNVGTWIIDKNSPFKIKV